MVQFFSETMLFLCFAGCCKQLLAMALLSLLLFFIGMRSMEGLTDTKRYGITKKSKWKKMKAYRKSFKKEPTVKRQCHTKRCFGCTSIYSYCILEWNWRALTMVGGPVSNTFWIDLKTSYNPCSKKFVLKYVWVWHWKVSVNL